MRKPHASRVLVVFLSLSISTGIALAQQGASKAPDVQTIDGVTRVVTTTPITLPMLAAARVAESTRRAAPAPEPGQLAKLESLWRLASEAPAAPTPFELAGGKFPHFSSTPDGSAADVARAPVLTPVLAPTGHPFAEVLGATPASAIDAKPAEVVTIGAPTGLEHATTMPAAKPASAPAHEPDLATTRPRDPSLPPPSPVKDAPAPEVRR